MCKSGEALELLVFIFVQLGDVHTRRIKDRIPSFCYFGKILKKNFAFIFLLYFFFKIIVLSQLDSKVVLKPLINVWLFLHFSQKTLTHNENYVGSI